MRCYTRGGAGTVAGAVLSGDLDFFLVLFLGQAKLSTRRRVKYSDDILGINLLITKQANYIT